MGIYKLILSILGRVAVLLAFPVGALVKLGLNSNSLMVIIIYFQLLVILMQAEVYERQNVLFLSQFEPSFRVRLVRPGGNLLTKNLLTIENVSQNPAYDVRISRVLYKNGEPVPPEEWSRKLEFLEEYPIQCLSPGESGILCRFPQLDILETYFFDKVFEISYQTRMGEIRFIRVYSSSGRSFSVVHLKRELPGFLHNLDKDIHVLILLIRLMRIR